MVPFKQSLMSGDAFKVPYRLSILTILMFLFDIVKNLIACDYFMGSNGVIMGDNEFNTLRILIKIVMELLNLRQNTSLLGSNVIFGIISAFKRLEEGATNKIFWRKVGMLYVLSWLQEVIFPFRSINGYFSAFKYM